MKLHNLKNNEGARHRKKRIGRGDSSGWGKSAGRGEKGQHSRSGSGRRLHFEGGQITLFRRLPKRGFKSMSRKEYTIFNVVDLEECFNANDIVDIAVLVEKKLVPKTHFGLKILGSGEITKPLTVKANVFSSTARQKIESAGGKCEIVK